jgi:hypothetical protein
MFDPTVRIPWGYSRSYKTLAEAETFLLVHYHREYIRRLLAWLSSQDGAVGIGGTWRAGGTQPVNVDGEVRFAPEGKSFHQDQKYADGFLGACAVDLVCPNGAGVHRAPRWDEVPAQGSLVARAWGVHCNVFSEPWHMQPVEIDGWQSWMNAGCPAPRPNYPLPGDDIDPPTVPPTGVALMGAPLVLRYGGTPTSNWSGYYSFDGVARHGVRGMHHAAQLVALGAIDARTLQPVGQRNWSDVTHTTDAEELDEWLTPGRD